MTFMTFLHLSVPVRRPGTCLPLMSKLSLSVNSVTFCHILQQSVNPLLTRVRTCGSREGSMLRGISSSLREPRHLSGQQYLPPLREPRHLSGQQYTTLLKGAQAPLWAAVLHLLLREPRHLSGQQYYTLP